MLSQKQLMYRRKLNAIAVAKYQSTHKEIVLNVTRNWRKKRFSFVNWDNMMARCYNSKNPKYWMYGAKGIRVYKPWHDFSTYEREWGITKPGPGYTVDRIDSAKGYEPGNVQWLTRLENTKKYLKERYK